LKGGKDIMDLTSVDIFRKKVKDNLAKVILGKEHVLDIVIMAVICNGHILIEDVPGTGKTILARSLAKSIGVEFSRIQFTPDMLPSDITGVSIYNQAKNEFEFRKGPIFANIILADEINRATPKTQSALLEAMEEKQITVDGVTNLLPEFFQVIATQNPIEYEGTFSLPEAQLDRFLVRLQIGYPDAVIEQNILESQKYQHPLNSIKQAVSLEELLSVQNMIKEINVSDKIRQYIVEIIRKTRNTNDIYLGSSTRGGLALYRLGQCTASFSGRDYVIPDDIKNVAPQALSHRIIFRSSIRSQDFDIEEYISELIQMVRVPGG
jgi:MoxR-like ATPase